MDKKTIIALFALVIALAVALFGNNWLFRFVPFWQRRAQQIGGPAAAIAFAVFGVVILFAAIGSLWIGISALVTQPWDSSTTPTDPPTPTVSNPVTKSDQPHAVKRGGDTIIPPPTARVAALARQFGARNISSSVRDEPPPPDRSRDVESARRRALLTQIINDYITSHDGVADTTAGVTDQATNYINEQLDARGETWTFDLAQRRALGFPPPVGSKWPKG